MTDYEQTNHRREMLRFASHLDSGTQFLMDTEQQLDTITSVLEQAELYRAELVAKARREEISWRRIGNALGLSKQAAQQRYGR